MAYPSARLDRRIANASAILGLASEVGMKAPNVEGIYAIAEGVLDLEATWFDASGEPTDLAEFANLPKADQAVMVEAEAWAAEHGDEVWARALTRGLVTGKRPSA